MKASEIREIKNEDLVVKIADMKKQLFSLRGQATTEKIENVRAIRNMKRDIARIKTIMNENQVKGK
jgi:large subunit ribosomal protein L29